MITVDLNSKISIEEQIRAGFHQLLLKGQLKAGDSLPSQEELATTLLVSPSAVSGAYGQLTKEGFLEISDSGIPVISSRAQASATKDMAEIVQEFLVALEAVRKQGLAWDEIESMIQVLKTENAEKDTIVPAIFKRLYFDANTARADMALCPYCRESVNGDTVSCFLCRTLHHAECWQETGHCSVYGCKGRVKVKP